jgi:hypothetical protein
MSSAISAQEVVKKDIVKKDGVKKEPFEVSLTS